MRAGYQVAVVGLGAVGSSALRTLARKGVRAVGIDRFSPPHNRGSSHGESRITRQAIGEGEAYVPLVLRSNELLEEIEAETGARLLERCGFLFLTRDDEGTSHHGKAGFMSRTQAAANRFGIAHEMLNAEEVRRRFPQFIGLVGDEEAYFEPGGGYIRPEACIEAQLRLAKIGGADVVINRRVLGERTEGSCIRLETDDGPISADHVIWSTGARLPQVGGQRIARQIKVHRQTLHWFDLMDASAYSPESSPTFIWTHGLTTADQFYGFPPIAGKVKVAREDYSGAFNPDEEEAEPDPAEAEAMAALHVRGRIAGVSNSAARSAVCHYAVTPDSDFIIESAEKAHIVSACSGHGFKHAPAVGEAVALAAIGRPGPADLSAFSMRRFEAQ